MYIIISLVFVNVQFTVPRRPHEIVLPAELLYEIKFNCSDVGLVGNVRAAVQDYLKARIRLHETCSASPTGCIVDNVSASCVRRRRRRQSAVNRPKRRPGRRKKRGRRRIQSADEATRRPRRRRGRRRRRHFQDRKSRRGRASPTLLAVQFSLATRLLDGGSPWPEDYHHAVTWLQAVYDDVEDQLRTNDFRLAQLEPALEGLVAEVADSLTEAPLKTVCAIGFEFNSVIRLCGTTSLTPFRVLRARNSLCS